MAKRRQQIVFPREVLLVEIERRCADEHCNTKNRIGLTRAEARAYHGFECARCERWHDDTLTERDVPDWWEELMVTSLASLRPPTAHAGGRADEPDADGAGEVVARLSAAWREAQASPDDERGEAERDTEARTS
jgi:hypothetical protein